eukprot:gnl/Hemi2/4716_TR1633_c0_g1_i1.p1 gnl/Hemi2/4716_TR1633_c0_g1~~gnl/Hemi2/4716_TR1633_c0_g1_i1.p1  ORF type:complete len:157 (-),score=16.84 gnl/Hemi2/4716_TR1633_c0_g1_i1:515-985(-)
MITYRYRTDLREKQLKMQDFGAAFCWNDLKLHLEKDLNKKLRGAYATEVEAVFSDTQEPVPRYTKLQPGASIILARKPVDRLEYQRRQSSDPMLDYINEAAREWNGLADAEGPKAQTRLRPTGIPRSQLRVACTEAERARAFMTEDGQLLVPRTNK